MVASRRFMTLFSITVVVAAVPSELLQRPPTDRQVSAPGTIIKRETTGSMSNPHITNINCADIYDLCEVDCHSILCKRAPNPVQYGKGLASTNRAKSGYSSSILRSSNNNRLKHGIDISDSTLDSVGRSMEESVMANAVQGGAGDVLYAVDAGENSLIGARLGGSLKKAKVKDDEWYFEWFMGWKNNPSQKYCPALQCDCDRDRENCPPCTPDFSVCRDTDDPQDPNNRAFVAEYVDQNNAANNKYHMMGTHDYWTGSYFGGPKKMRDVVSRKDYRYGEPYYSGGSNANVPESHKKISPPEGSDPDSFSL